MHIFISLLFNWSNNNIFKTATAICNEIPNFSLLSFCVGIRRKRPRMLHNMPRNWIRIFPSWDIS